MRRIYGVRGSVLILTVVTIAAALPVQHGTAQQQEPDGSFDRRIYLKTRILEDPGVDGAFLDAIKASEHPVHGLVQLESLPRLDVDDASDLKDLGIVPLDYLNGVDGVGTAYLAAFEPGLASEDSRFKALVRGLQPLLPNDKLSPLVDGPGELLVQLFGDVSPEQAEEVFARHGLVATPRSSTQWVVVATVKEAHALAVEDLVQWIESLPAPQPRVDVVRATHRVNGVQDLDTTAGVYGGPTGFGVQIGIMDTGVDADHRDFAGRIIRPRDDGGDHGSHVAGIAAGSGLQSDASDDAGTPNMGTFRQWRGMAPRAQIAAYPMSGADVITMGDAVLNQGVDVSNHSYGYGTQAQYIASDVTMDSLVRGLATTINRLGDGTFRTERVPARPMVQAVGNNGNLASRDCDGDGTNDGMWPQSPGGCPVGWKAGYFSILDANKNTIGAANVTNALVPAGSSSLGPTLDGRLKPDLSAVGTGVISVGSNRDGQGNPVPGNGYRPKGGTSMASPAVAGIIALLLERYADLTGADLDEDPPLPSTWKSILVQTAVDLVGSNTSTNPDTGAVTSYGAGPDWATGFGAVDAAAAIQLLEDGSYAEGSVDVAAPAASFPLDVQTGQTVVKVSLAWDDLPGTPNANDAARQLINDLDLTVVEPDGTVHRPLVLPIPTARDCDGDPSNGLQVATCAGLDNPAQDFLGPATEGIDRRNNVEQVVVVDAAGLPGGTWTINVSATDGRSVRLPLGGDQAFSLAWDEPGTVLLAPDRLEGPSGFQDLAFTSHRHFDTAIVEDNSRTETSRELWRGDYPDLTLHNPADIDRFSIDLPDPAETHPDVHPDPSITEPLPDCGVLERRGGDPFGGEDLTDTIFVTGTFRASVDYDRPLGDGLWRDDPLPPGESLSFSVPCPHTTLSETDDLRIGIGLDTLSVRTSFTAYDLRFSYDIVLQRVPGESDWLRTIREANEGRGATSVVPIGCGDGIFPICAPPSSPAETTVAHPASFGVDCRADGPGCPMYHPFAWDAAGEFDLRFHADPSFTFELLAADGGVMAKAAPIGSAPQEPISEPFGGAREDGSDLLPQRLLVPDLEPGFYVLRAIGPRSEYLLRFFTPPPAQDRDQDGLPDHLDACPELAEDADGVADGDGCPDVDVDVDVKPGDEEAAIDPLAHGVVPVAILTSASFDAMLVDASRVCFGPADDPFAGDCTPRRAGHEDVDGDGDADLVLHFDSKETGLEPADNGACVVAKGEDGTVVEGCDSVRVLNRGRRSS